MVKVIFTRIFHKPTREILNIGLVTDLAAVNDDFVATYVMAWFLTAKITIIADLSQSVTF